MAEQIRFALSRDGREWTALNRGDPVLVSALGEKGARDPYLLRSHDGQKFHLIATDLSIHLNGGDWTRAARAGSRSILVWESPDLASWSGPRLVKVAPDDAGCTWAPEAVHDAETGDYLVFWASTTRRDHFAKHRIWAARTRDFVTFGEPFVFIEKPAAVIDTTIIHDGSAYYRFSKDERLQAITLETADRLSGEWREVAGFNLGKLIGYEGPQIYPLEPAVAGRPPVWGLILDHYAKSLGYQPYVTRDLASGMFESDAGFTFPFKFRHGSVLPISGEEFARMERFYGEQAACTSEAASQASATRPGAVPPGGRLSPPAAGGKIGFPVLLLLVLVALVVGGFWVAMIQRRESPAPVRDRIVVKVEGRADQVTHAEPPAEPPPGPESESESPPSPVPEVESEPTTVPVPQPVEELGPQEAEMEPEAPLVSIDPLRWLIANRHRWPAEVTLLEATEFAVIDEGREVGALTVPAGGRARLVTINADGVAVGQGRWSRQVPVDATDLRARAEVIMATPPPVFVRAPKPPPASAAAPVPEAAPVGKGFVHPGLLHTEEDLERMRSMVRARRSPWIEGWGELISSSHAQLGWQPRATEEIIRGAVPGQNSSLLFNDAHAAYQLALRWRIGGDARYAENAAEILNAWSSTLKRIDGNADRFLAAGIYGYQMANAAEIMRTYPGWSAAGLRRFQTMMLEVFYPLNQDFLFGRGDRKHHNGAAITNYWANWDLSNIASMQAIGVLCDRRDIYDEAMDYFKTGGGNGAMDKMVYHVHDGNLGQWQESGRDQGHTTLGIALAGPILETAWNQGEDLYGHRNNRFLAGAEYVAKYNLGHEVPFQTYAWGIGPRGDFRQQTAISGDQGVFRAGYELVINHYVNRKGIAAPYSERYAARLRPEPAPRGHASTFDQMGLGTLTATRATEVADPAPSGLVVRKREAAAVLSWWGAAGADSYRVKRSATAGGPYVTVAADVKDLLVWTDRDGGSDEVFYVVTGVINGRETRPSNEVRFSPGGVLRVHLPFDEFRGAAARDSAGKTDPATMHGKVDWTRGVLAGSAGLDGESGHVALPAGVVGDLSDFTIAAWVFLDRASRGARIFDFGDDRGHWMSLTPVSDDGTPRFAVATVYHYNEQRIDSSVRFATGRWVHVAVTLSGAKGSLYLDGALVGENPRVDFPPFTLGPTPRNWIGRSQSESDPYLAGKVDDFRIYDGALSAEEVGALARAGAGR